MKLRRAMRHAGTKTFLQGLFLPGLIHSSPVEARICTTALGAEPWPLAGSCCPILISTFAQVSQTVRETGTLFANCTPRPAPMSFT